MLYTIAQASKELNCSARHVRRLCNAGKIPVIRIGDAKKSDRISEDDLFNYIKRSKRLGDQKWLLDDAAKISRLTFKAVDTELDELLKPKRKPKNYTLKSRLRSKSTLTLVG